jgi:predicted DsbA family dithiol-disulfide isomerase
MEGAMAPLTVEIWSDVVCPWCYVGKRRFERALAEFEHRDDVEVVWRSFELDPNAPPEREVSSAEHLASKYGMSVEQAERSNAQMTELAASEGLEYHLDRTRGGNSFDAHRLIHLAAANGRQDAMKERLMRAYFTEGEPVGDTETLVRLATEVGLDEHEARTALDGEAYADTVHADEELAARIGIRGVPFFVLDRRYGVSGAQPSELLLQVLEKAWEARADAA